MKVLKRNGIEVDFNLDKIYGSICRANEEVIVENAGTATSTAVIKSVAKKIYERCRKRHWVTPCEEIRDMIEVELMKAGAYDVARRYIRYRCDKEQEAEHSQEVFLFTQKGCPKCLLLKRAMGEARVDYDEITDVQTIVSMGIERTPTLLVGGEIMTYDQATAWIAKRKEGDKKDEE